MLGVMSDDGRSPAGCASDIDDARERLVAFAGSCAGEQWTCAPLEGDPRPVGVIVDHVADSYEYLAGWMRRILAGEAVTVTADIVDGLNAEHAVAAAAVTQAEAVDHLRRSGAELSALVAGCAPDHLSAGDGQVERLARVAIRHADSHRAEIEAALAESGS
jgi:DinB superfamily